MPRNQFQRMVFAFLTVIITVHGYVLYSLYAINGDTLRALNGTNSVLEAINNQGGIYMCGKMVPIWAVVLTEFVCAYVLEVLMGSPVSYKIASKFFNPEKDNPMVFESAIICATVGIMCPAMSLIAAVLYFPYYSGFSFVALLTSWFNFTCFNFPFAFFSQLFFIQPIVRRLFKLIFKKDIKKRELAQANQ